MKKTAEEASRTEAIRARIAQGGGTLQAIATEFGVTRQYVSTLKLRMSNKTFTPPGRKGRRPEVPFTPLEYAAFTAALKGPPPGAAQQHPPQAAHPAHWMRSQARRWFQNKFGRQPQLRQLANLAEENGIVFAPEKNPKNYDFPDAKEELQDEDFLRWQASPEAARIREQEEAWAHREKANTPAAKRKKGRPPGTLQQTGKAKGKEDAGTDEMESRALSDDDVAAMARENAAVAAKLSGAPRPYRAPSPKMGRNDPCPHNPALKFKRCCGANGGRYCLRIAAG
ncbi:MAG: hypothetical protein LBV54_08945 [Puniceicoccales bacterium]|nr:hypothetical protein [Puniceicoccales bacterium]